MQVGDILRKKAARVATVRMNETVAIAAQLMRSSNISALVVKDVVRTEGNTAVGMFTERDVVRAIAEHGAACPSPHEQASHPPRAGHRQLQPDRRHQHSRHLQRVRRRSNALQPGRLGLTGRFEPRRNFLELHSERDGIAPQYQA
jgi:CBS domain